MRSVGPVGISQRIPQRMIEGRFREFSVEDDAHLLVELEGGKGDWVSVLAEGSWTERDSPPFFVQGTAGHLRSSGAGEERRLVLEDNFEFSRAISVPKWGSFEMELSNAVSCVRDGTKSISDEDVGLATTAAMGAAYLSEMRGRAAVTLDEFKNFAHGFSDGEQLVKELIKGIKRERS